MKTTILVIALVFSSALSNAQQTAMQFTGLDCNNNTVDLFADLDAGKAVVLFYYMPNCGACPPPAMQIQSMANGVMNTYPGMVKAYAYPFQNSTTCSYSASWVTSNSLSLYTPMDSGATQVAYYGGFGMPTVVLLGGADHRVLFVTQNYLAGDTAIMRDSILGLFGATAVADLQGGVMDIRLFPSPANDQLQFELNTVGSAGLKVDILNLAGELVSSVYPSGNVVSGFCRMNISTAHLSSGVYLLRVSSDVSTQQVKFVVAH